MKNEMYYHRRRMKAMAMKIEGYQLMKTTGYVAKKAGCTGA